MRLASTDDQEEFEYWEAEIMSRDRRFRRQRHGLRSQPAPDQIRSQLADEGDDAVDFLPSYARALDPLHYERKWIINSLGGFYRDNLISDVTQLVKGGKEANVYCCQAGPASDLELIAAKLYRPRVLRHLRNDALYKEGRGVLDSDGKEVWRSRESRALKKKTRFGKHLGFTSWIVHEFRVHTELYMAGADVPKPVAQRGNAILMAFLGDAWMAAPTLSEISLGPEEAQPLFDRIIGNIELMLNHHYVHGDLSAYNILYWDGRITIIDFPQLVDARSNRSAFMLLERDVRRVCQYFARFGVKSDPDLLAAGMWQDWENSD